MNSIPKIILYQNVFSKWAGGSVRQTDDFETYCDCNYDFIELLLIFERAFALNLLDNAIDRYDFIKVRDFLSWIQSQPKATEAYIPFRFHEPEVIPILV